MNILKKIFSHKTKNSIDVNYNSPDFYAGMYYVLKNDKTVLNTIVSYFNKCNKKYKKDKNINTYFIKINMKDSYLVDEDFIDIITNFRIIVENFCDFFEIDNRDLELSILSATPGCFNINFGINICNNNFSLINLPDAKKNLILPIIEYLTHKKIEEHPNFMSMFKDCISGYLSRKMDPNIAQLKYIDIKKSNEAKKLIIKTLQKQTNFELVSFNGEIVLSSEMDVLV